AERDDNERGAIARRPRDPFRPRPEEARAPAGTDERHVGAKAERSGREREVRGDAPATGESRARGELSAQIEARGDARPAKREAHGERQRGRELGAILSFGRDRPLAAHVPVLADDLYASGPALRETGDLRHDGLRGDGEERIVPEARANTVAELGLGRTDLRA